MQCNILQGGMFPPISSYKMLDMTIIRGVSKGSNWKRVKITAHHMDRVSLLQNAMGYSTVCFLLTCQNRIPLVMWSDYRPHKSRRTAEHVVNILTTEVDCRDVLPKQESTFPEQRNVKSCGMFQG